MAHSLRTPGELLSRGEPITALMLFGLSQVNKEVWRPTVSVRCYHTLPLHTFVAKKNTVVKRRSNSSDIKGPNHRPPETDLSPGLRAVLIKAPVWQPRVHVLHLRVSVT